MPRNPSGVGKTISRVNKKKKNAGHNTIFDAAVATAVAAKAASDSLILDEAIELATSERVASEAVSVAKAVQVAADYDAYKAAAKAKLDELTDQLTKTLAEVKLGEKKAASLEAMIANLVSTPATIPSLIIDDYNYQ